MAVENGYGTGLDMVVDEENNENNLENEKEDDETEKKSIDEVNCDKTKDDETPVVMEVVEVQENDPLESTDDNQGEEPKKEDEFPPEPVVTEYVNEFSGTIISNSNSNSSTSNSVPIEPIVKIKEEPSEIVLIDSEDEKEEKPKVKSIPTRSVQIRQNPKPSTNRVSAASVPSTANPVGHSRGNNGDFQIVSVDDDSPMNKNDPMNVFLCSTEEREFRKDYFKDPSSNVLKQRLHCTICDIHIGACPQNSKNMVCHRFLKVLICRKCANFYGQGEFPQDEGSDEFCRWCGEGGEVFLCNSCSNVFCQACILRNFGMQEIKRVDRLDNWDCYVCDTRPLWTLRAIAFALFTYVRRIKVVAYRNGMYQTINTSNAKVSKSDLMALETDLSTCCPKEVKAAAAAASNPPPSEIEIPKTPPVASNVTVKPKENKAPSVPPSRSSGPVKGTVQGKVVDGLVQYIHSDVPVQSPPVQQVYNQPATRSSKRSKPPPKQLAGAPWQQPQILPDYFAGQGKRVGPPPPFGMPQPPVLFPQSTLRSALVGQPGAFMPSPPQIVPNSFGGPNHMMVYGNKDGQSEPNVLHWFNGILSSLMDTVKNIDNRLVFIRNSTSNLISQNEVSFLVNQLHNLLKVSCSKMQEVDCDLLKNYKEFIDKSAITVNDFDDIVREFPEFFKPGTESSPDPEEPESNNDTEPDPPDDFNPMALVEVIEEGDQQPHSTAASSKSDAASKSKKSISAKNNGNGKKSSNKSSSDTQRCTLTIKKEIITLNEVSDSASSLEGDASGKNKTTNGSVKRKLEDSAHGNSVNKNKVRAFETVHIKQEKEDDSENSSELQQTSEENSSVNSTNVLVSPVSESHS